MPDTKIADFGNTINAFATGTDKEPYVVIGNLAPKLLNPKELHFIIYTIISPRYYYTRINKKNL